MSGGSVLKRAAFQKMLADLEEKGDIDMVIVWSVSRWARDEENLWVAYGSACSNATASIWCR